MILMEQYEITMQKQHMHHEQPLCSRDFNPEKRALQCLKTVADHRTQSNVTISVTKG